MHFHACLICLLGCILLATVVVADEATVQLPTSADGDTNSQILQRLEERLDEIESQNQELREANRLLLGELEREPQPGLAPNAARTITRTPGDGVTISMLNDSSELQFGAAISALAIASTKRPFSSGLPLFLLPESPTEQNSNTFDLHARQTTLFARFSGPEVGGLTPGGEILTLFMNDNLTTDNYGLLVYYAYGELKNEDVRIAAGLQRDIFNPVGPNVLPFSLLYGSGNPGSYRGQIRFERFLHLDNEGLLTLQTGLSEPIATIVRSVPADPLVEDNGWPNVEARVSLALGPIEDYMGGRKQRAVEMGVSGVVGQIRSTRVDLGTPGPLRVVQDIWALGSDLQLALTDRFGVFGEFFVGQTLADYNAGILQNFNSDDYRPIRTIGGYGEIYHYLTPKLHMHCGYGIDDPYNEDLAAGQASSNQTIYNTLLYDLSRAVQFGFEVDYRKTTFAAPAIDAEGFLFMTQFIWRF
jgi:hypothetical protein